MWFLRIKIWLFLRAVRLYFCMGVYLYDLCVFCSLESVILRIYYFASYLRNLGVCCELTQLFAMYRLQNNLF